MHYYSHGKLLISGEYSVLDGALALAIPTSFGQHLRVEDCEDGLLHWESFDPDGLWFAAEFKIQSSEKGTKVTPASYVRDAPVSEVANTLCEILEESVRLNPDFLRDGSGKKVTTTLEFPRDWGLGSSSTLLSIIAAWAGIDPYILLNNTIGGSGYDIACANSNGPIIYQLQQGKPIVQEVRFSPPFSEHLYFVYLNKKALSGDAISNYKTLDFDRKIIADRITGVTQNLLQCSAITEFEALLKEHELILSEVLEQPPVKTTLFPDFQGAVKSLGAWGGDFVLATGDKKTPLYFKQKGFDVVIPYKEMVFGLKN